VALAAAAVGVVAQETNATNVMITLEEWNTILMTEASADFGAYDTPALDADGQEGLWTTATQWQWDYNQINRTLSLGEGYNFAPYAVCSLVPGLSGVERFEAIAELLRAAAIAEGTVIYSIDSLYNDEDRTCRVISAETALFKAVLDSQPADVLQYLQVQPLLSAMKQIEGAFQGVMDTMASIDCAEDDSCEEGDGTITVVTGGSYNGARKKTRYLQEKSVALVVLLSPIVLHFTRTGELTYEEIINELLEFTTGSNGLNVAEASYYDFQAEFGGVTTERMEFYSNVIQNVTSLTAADGSNTCLDVVLPNDVKIARMGTNETVSVHVETVGGDLTTLQLDDCLWYLIYSLSLHPYVRFMELKADVVLFPPPGGGEGGETSASPSSITSALALVVALAVSTFFSGLSF